MVVDDGVSMAILKLVSTLCQARFVARASPGQPRSPERSLRGFAAATKVIIYPSIMPFHASALTFHLPLLAPARSAT